MLARERDRDVARPARCRALDEAGIGAFEDLDGVVRTHGPPRRFRHGLEVFGAELDGRIRLFEQLESAFPLEASHGLSCCRQRISIVALIVPVERYVLVSPLGRDRV